MAMNQERIDWHNAEAKLYQCKHLHTEERTIMDSSIGIETYTFCLDCQRTVI